MKRTTLYVVLGVVVVAAVIAGAVWRMRLAAQPEEEARSAVVERGTMLVAVSSSGNVEPLTRVGLTFDLPGRVAEVAVGAGDEVAAGDVLARLDTTDLEFAVQQAEISLRAAELRLERVQEPPDDADIEIARAAVSDAAAAYQAAQSNLTLTEHSVSVGEAVRAAARARDDTYRFYQNLVDRLGEEDRNTELAHNAYLDALGAYNRAVESSEMQMTTAQNDVTRAYHALQQAQDSLDRLLEGADEADVEAAQLDVDAAELSLEKARVDLEEAALSAPFDGVVAVVNVTVGEAASAGLPAITLLDTSAFRLTISVDEMDVGRLAVGQSVQVTLDALPDAEINGAVERIAPAATLEGGVVYYEVVVGLEPADVAIRADMTANATIVVEELADVLTIPTWVVRVDSSTGQTYVNRKVGEDVERVDVELGVRYEGIAQVLDGLAEGDVVVWVESTMFELGHP